MTASTSRFKGEARHIDFHKLIGKQVFIYDQKEVVTDLIAKRLADGGQILFEVEDTSVHDFDGAQSENPLPPSRANRRRSSAISSAAATASTASAGRAFRPACCSDYDRVYPFGWLGILSDSPPPDHELIYCFHERGFALFSMRGPELSRLYVQVPPDEDVETMARRAHLGRTGDAARRRAAARSAARFCRRASRRCEASSPSRCSRAGCSSPATPPTSCRRPAPRA